MSIGEQRYQAVLAVLAGDPVMGVAEKVGVSRQSLHTWLRRYADEGLSGLQPIHVEVVGLSAEGRAQAIKRTDEVVGSVPARHPGTMGVTSRHHGRRQAMR